MRVTENRVFSVFLSLVLFLVFNFCAVESMASSISSKFSFTGQSNHSPADHADGHSHHSGASHGHDGNTQDENCCSNVLAIQPSFGISPAKNLTLEPVVSRTFSLPAAAQNFSDKISYSKESSLDSNSSPPAVYRATYPSHAPPFHA